MRKRSALSIQHSAFSSRHSTRRRGMLLIVVLMIISLLALVATTFSFKMQADLAAVKARQDLSQAEHAARAGIDRAIKLLRDQRVDIDKWYENEQYFRRTLIWAPDKIGGSESLADQEAIPGRPAWRVSVVGYKFEGFSGDNNSVKMRYGVTDEASKININTASRAQFLLLFDQIKPDHVTSEQLTDALLDWRDEDDRLTSIHGAESSYYMTLNPPYRAKNRPFETVEELLMVKGFDGQLLYGEDYNRNGYLDPNEDDGPEGSFPPDDGDGKLDRGLLPYLTVYSWDWNLSNDNQRRVDLNRADFTKVDKLPESVRNEIKPEILDFIAEARKRNYRFKSVGELLGLEVFEDGSSNYDEAWQDYIALLRETGRVLDSDRPEAQETGDQSGQEGDRGRDERDSAGGRSDERDSGNREAGRDDRDRDERDGGRDGRDGREDERDGSDRRDTDENDERSGNRNADDRRGDTRSGSGRNSDDDRGRNDSRDDDEDSETAGSKNEIRRNQSIRDENAGSSRDSRGPSRSRNPGSRNGNDGNDANNTDGSDRDEQDSEDGDRGREGRNDDETDNDARRPNRDGRRSEEGGRDAGRRGGRRGENQEGRPPSGDRRETGGRGSGRGKGTPVSSPVTPEDMGILMDRLTANPVPATAGLINVNTALPEVIQTIPGLTQAEAEAIVEKRTAVDPAQKSTPAWLVSSGAVDAQTFALIANQITTRSIQFTIDAIGFADHTGAFKRLQAVVEMRGQLAQLKYYRDISSLGMGYPVRDDERSEGFAFDR